MLMLTVFEIKTPLKEPVPSLASFEAAILNFRDDTAESSLTSKNGGPLPNLMFTKTSIKRGLPSASGHASATSLVIRVLKNSLRSFGSAGGGEGIERPEIVHRSSRVLLISWSRSSLMRAKMRLSWRRRGTTSERRSLTERESEASDEETMLSGTAGAMDSDSGGKSWSLLEIKLYTNETPDSLFRCTPSKSKNVGGATYGDINFSRGLHILVIS